MSSHRVVPTRRSRDEDDDSDESESTSPSPPSSNKRPRLSEAQGDVRGDEGEQSDSDSDASDRPENSTQVIAPRATVDSRVGPGGYKPGAIVRIKVTNFVTYTSAEFFPGPKLNMVIGPNGTGKSTLVCAICLGLGWGPQVRPVPLEDSSLLLYILLTRNLFIASRTCQGSGRIREAWLPRSDDRDRTRRSPEIQSKPSDLSDHQARRE